MLSSLIAVGDADARCSDGRTLETAAEIVA
jgi:hypothetical protein